MISREAGGLRAYASVRQIHEPPSDVLKRAAHLEETLARFRDHRIVHPQNVLIQFGTTWSLASGETDLMPTLMYPTPAQIEAGPLPIFKINELTDEIDVYVAEVLKWVEGSLGAGVVAT